MVQGTEISKVTLLYYNTEKMIVSLENLNEYL